MTGSSEHAPVDRLTISITRDDGRGTITRHTFDRMHVSDLLGHEPPAWIAERGHQGGQHTLETCEACAARAYVQSRRGEQWAREDATYVAETDRLINGTSRVDRFEPDVPESEHTAAIRRQYGRILRIARMCPERRIPEIHKALRRMQGDLVNATTQQQQALGIVCGVAADIAWSRWMDARQGGVKVPRHGTSSPARILWSDLDHVDKQAMVRNSAGHWSND